MPDPILHNLHARPKASDIYLWSDYVELRCLVHIDRKFSRGNLLELLEETTDFAPQDLGITDSEEPNDDNADIAEEEDNEAIENVQHDLPNTDKNESKVADIFKNLAYRASIFGDAYPFVLDDAQQEISLADSDTPLSNFYLQLLLSSSLRLVPKKRRHELTERFEKLSTVIFTCLMPMGWEVHQFGAKGSTRYRGHLFTRLEKLAKDLRGKLDVSRHHYTTTNAGDGGLDIVAWHPMGNDERIGIPIALAQCGCTAEEWSLKSLEASPAMLGSNLKTHHPWATYYFMPQDLVDGRGTVKDWQRRPSLSSSIVIDRLRLIRLATQYGVITDCGNASELVTEARELEVI